MIYQLIVFFGVIGLCALLNYGLGAARDIMFSFVDTEYASIATGIAYEFLKSFHIWIPLLMVIIPALIWFFVNIQKPGRSGY